MIVMIIFLKRCSSYKPEKYVWNAFQIHRPIKQVWWRQPLVSTPIGSFGLLLYQVAYRVGRHNFDQLSKWIGSGFDTCQTLEHCDAS